MQHATVGFLGFQVQFGRDAPLVVNWFSWAVIHRTTTQSRTEQSITDALPNPLA
jgi:hypothetical protein